MSASVESVADAARVGSCPTTIAVSVATTSARRRVTRIRETAPLPGMFASRRLTSVPARPVVR
jgi:hypothetical protein